MMENWERGGFGIYVHWPFCAAKCPYCDFNSHVTRQVDHAAYRDAYLAEIDYWAERTPDRILSTVFFGGGTPSLMHPDTTAAIIDRIRSRWPTANDLEITLEANPTSVEADRFRAFVDAGVTRFSVGLQALRDEDLRALGRMHNVAEGRRAYNIARSLCERVSFDLIYARQNQSLSDWEAELTQALSWGPDHLSLYQLTIEDGTAFGDRYAAGGLRGLPGEDLGADMYEVTQAITEAAGLPRYEVSNHARPGTECRHNLVYWRGGDWVGVGPGAHGRLDLGETRQGTANLLMPEGWRSAVAAKGVGLAEQNIIQDIEKIEEYIMMGLRLRDGIDLSHVRDLGFETNQTALANLAEDGLIMSRDDRLMATDRGTLVLNQVIAALLPLQPLGQQGA